MLIEPRPHPLSNQMWVLQHKYNFADAPVFGDTLYSLLKVSLHLPYYQLYADAWVLQTILATVWGEEDKAAQQVMASHGLGIEH